MNKTANTLVKMSLVAAIYFVLTLMLAPVSYGPVQFRVAEILNMLAFYNPVFGPGVTLGVFFSNLSSPLGIYDLIFGTLHTFVSLFAMSRTKNKIIASLWPSLFSFIIGIELFLVYGGGFKGFLTMTLSVMLSEFIICTVVSLGVYNILEKNSVFSSLVLTQDSSKK